MSVTYYHIKDMNLLGKEEECIPYLYKQSKGWVVDNDNILMDRIMGYDDSEPSGSPYKIGNSSIIQLVVEISKEEADRVIDALTV